MKSKVAMAVSIAGVLVAGSAAALVNTHVLDSSASPASFSIDAASQAQSTTSTVSTTAPTVTTTSVVTGPTVPGPTVPGPSVTGPTDVATTLSTVAAPATQVVYAIGAAGSVTLDTVGDVLTIVAVDPVSGWVVTKSETEDANNVEVRLESGNSKAEFHANLLFGVITTSIETDDGSSGSGSNSGSGSGSDDSGSGSSSSGSGSSGHGGGGDDD